MEYTPESIKLVVEKGMPDARVSVSDMTGTRDHYQVTIISKSFQGKSLIERHRMVYALFGTAVGGEIHALSLKTKTPEEIK